MAVVELNAGGSGDLATLPGANAGLDADQVHVGTDSTPQIYDIYTYGAGDSIDLRDGNAGNLHSVWAGIGADTVLGGAANDSYWDQSGKDRASLGVGDDMVVAGRGNDRLDGGAGRDALWFNYIVDDVTGGLRSNIQGVACDLTLTNAQDFGLFGRDRIAGFEDVVGSAGHDRIFGTGGANSIETFFGNDLLVGRGGADTLRSGLDRDTLIGGAGGDTLVLDSEDGARDLVRYLKISDSRAGAGMDDIQGFVAGQDKIDLRAIDARPSTQANEAFVFRGSGAFRSAGGEVRFVVDDGDLLVLVDTDADAAAEMVLRVDGVTSLLAADFIL
jgi:Ca2+-binding RTX toxin-like protein